MYTVVGADEKEYGPVSADQLRQWIREGRANGQTRARFEGGAWKPLAAFPDFEDELRRIAPPPIAAPGELPGQMLELPPKTSGLALAGFVFGLLGALQCCSLVGSTLGLVFSILGYYQIQENPRQLTGKSYAVAGMILSLAGFAIFAMLWWAGALDIGRWRREFNLE